MFNFLTKYRLFAQIVLVLIVLTFALFGVESYFRGSDSASVVAEVGTSGISQQEFGMMVSQSQDRLRQQVQENPQAAEYLQSDAFKRSVLDDMIQRRLLLQHASDMGMAVSDSELREVISTVEPFFDDNGNFSAEKYEQLLKAQNLSPADFEMQIKQDLLVGRMMDAISQTAIVSDSMVRRLVLQRGQKREVSQLIFSPANYRDGIEVSDDEVRTYFDENAELFIIPERAKVEFVVLNEEIVASTVEVDEEDLKASYEARISEFQSNEERRASHILISVAENAEAAALEEALNRAREVLKKIESEPDKFSELAAEYSNDPGSAEAGGDLGYFERGLMVQAFDEAVFNAKVGEVVGPVETEYGFHLIRLDDIKSVETTPFDEVKEQLAKDIRKARVDEVYLEASQMFNDLVYTEFDSLEPVASELNLTVQTSDWISRESAGFNTMLNNPDLLQAIFSAEVLEEKRNTQAYEVQPKTLVSARLVEYALEESMKFEDVSGDILDFLKSRGALEQAILDGEAALKELVGGGDLSDGEWSKPQMVTLLERQGLHPEGLRAVFGMSKDSLPGYAGMEIDDGRYVIFRVTDIVDLQEVSDDDVVAAKNQLEQMMRQQQISAYISSLREKSNVRIKADLFSDVTSSGR